MDVEKEILKAGNWMLENTHRALLALTGGRFPHRMSGMQVVELHAIGRKTGERRSTLLTAPVFEPDRVVLVASKGGYPSNPIWYENLVANPDIELTVEGETSPWRARTAAGAERAELWDRVVKVNPGYAGYQKRTEREIPVVVCEPRDPAG